MISRWQSFIDPINKAAWQLVIALLFGPLDLVNSWKAVNRIMIGEFDCTQIRTSTSFSFEEKKIFVKYFFGFLIFCSWLNRPFDKIWGGEGNHFWTPTGTFLAKFRGYRHDLARLFGSKGLIFSTVSSELKFHGGLPKKIIKIRPTVAELSVKNHLSTVNAHP